MKRKKESGRISGGFTMVEVVLILMIISTALITIISGVSKTTRYVSEMRQRTIALNLAKEGIEAVYNIRDTNWRRRSATRDQCRLKAEPMVDQGNDGDCSNENWMIPGRSSLESVNKLNNEPNNELNGRSLKHIVRTGEGYQSAFNQTLVKEVSSLVWQIQHLIPAESNPEDPHFNYKMHNIDGKWVGKSYFDALTEAEKEKENASLGHYWRYIAVDGVFSKETGNRMDCENGQGDCGNGTPKEFRFCSTVIYTQPYQGIVNVCSIMSNFLE